MFFLKKILEKHLILFLNFMKKILYLLIPLFLFLNYYYLHKKEYLKYTGFTQGTTYNIIYETKKDFSLEIDSILNKIDNSLSIYNPQSIISKLNNNKEVVLDDYFKNVFIKAKNISEQTNGLFDLTVAPLVNAWGFGFKNKTEINEKLIDSLLQFVGFEKIRLENNKIIKSNKQICLDANAIAQGYTVDVIVDFFKSEKIENYLVEVGGELTAKGVNKEGDIWRVGIDKPIENSNAENRELQVILNLKDKSLATSGNYRKFYEENGIKYSHSINPKTGYPVKDSLLSATIIADDAMTADAFATSFMLMGLEQTKIFLKKHQELDAYLIYSNKKAEFKVFYTENIKDILNTKI